MNKIAIHIFAISIFFQCNSVLASPAATQQWVRYFTATNGAESMTSTVYTNGVMETVAVDGIRSVRISIEDASVYALRATNVTAATTQAHGITNGFTFVWRGETATNGIFRTAGKTIYATLTNYVFGTTASTNSTNLSWFNSDFAVFGIRLQPSVAAQFEEGN